MRIVPRSLSRLCAAAVLLYAGALPYAPAAVTDNLTGLPTYPRLDRAVMDGTWRTESLGRWCAKYTASTGDSLDAVEDWYRRAMYRASETDLTRDERYKVYPTLTGIKLAMGVDYVALYRFPNQPTIIELHLCGANR